MLQNENCQYKILDRVYYADLNEMVEKIKKGAVLRNDQVKIGDSIWTEAEKIPELARIFEESEKILKVPEGVDFKNILTNFQITETNFKTVQESEDTLEKACSIHTNKKPVYICTICESLFCKSCPARDHNNDPICPFCGGNCALYMKQVWKFENKKTEAVYELEEERPVEKAQNYEVVYTKLKFKDFVNALTYPFRFPFALLIGGILFSSLVLGQIVTMFKGGAMLLATSAITVLIMMLQFGILLKCFENFSLNNSKYRSYIPHIRKFALFEDFVRPFFIGISTYLLAFGLFIVLAIASGFYAWFGFSANVEKIEAEMLKSGEQVNSVISSDPRFKKLQDNELRAMIDKTHLNQLESVFGKNQLADNEELAKLLKSVTRLTLWFQMPLCFAFILGILFFPAICLSTGENNFESLKNRFISGFKMMRTIGFDYVKILFMCIVLVMFSLAVIYGLSFLFSKLEMPVAGIFAAIVAGSFLIFYFWTAFSTILSITLLKKETVFEQNVEDFAN